jgi:hypothetical protein
VAPLLLEVEKNLDKHRFPENKENRGKGHTLKEYTPRILFFHNNAYFEKGCISRGISYTTHYN